LEGVNFGTVFTDHMFLAEYDTTMGWSRPLIKPFGPLHIHPAAQVLHYGLACFEGMKAYYGADGHTRLFRPDMNMQRLHRSANRLELADFDPKELLESLKALLRVDRAWLPHQQGNSIYIRPFMFSNADVLGVSRSTKTTLSILLSPVGPYFPGGLKPIRLFIDETRRRAWPGGVGQFKVAGNYAPTIKPQVEAAQKYGASQVVYTFSNPGTQASPDPDSATFAECGAMNVFFLIENPYTRNTGSSSKKKKRELVTPPLDGTILPGITRDSILQLAREWGEFDVSERQVTIGEVRQAASEGRLIEVFGSGTACIVQPVGELVREGGEMMKTTAGNGGGGGGSSSSSSSSSPGGRSLAERFQGELMDIQYGRKAHHPWSVVVD
jgi:branched-chain amino acid aminotransferase